MLVWRERERTKKQGGENKMKRNIDVTQVRLWIGSFLLPWNAMAMTEPRETAISCVDPSHLGGWFGRFSIVAMFSTLRFSTNSDPQVERSYSPDCSRSPRVLLFRPLETRRLTPAKASIWYYNFLSCHFDNESQPCPKSLQVQLAIVSAQDGCLLNRLNPGWVLKTERKINNCSRTTKQYTLSIQNRLISSVSGKK